MMWLLGFAIAIGPLVVKAQAARQLGQCRNIDNGALDKSGDACAWYNNASMSCGKYDDSNFKAHAMCCACGGGAGSTQSGATTTVATTRFHRAGFLANQTRPAGCPATVYVSIPHEGSGHLYSGNYKKESETVYTGPRHVLYKCAFRDEWFIGSAGSESGNEECLGHFKSGGYALAHGGSRCPHEVTHWQQLQDLDSGRKILDGGSWTHVSNPGWVSSGLTVTIEGPTGFDDDDAFAHTGIFVAGGIFVLVMIIVFVGVVCYGTSPAKRCCRGILGCRSDSSGTESPSSRLVSDGGPRVALTEVEPTTVGPTLMSPQALAKPPALDTESNEDKPKAEAVSTTEAASLPSLKQKAKAAKAKAAQLRAQAQRAELMTMTKSELRRQASGYGASNERLAIADAADGKSVFVDLILAMEAHLCTQPAPLPNSMPELHSNRKEAERIGHPAVSLAEKKDKGLKKAVEDVLGDKEEETDEESVIFLEEDTNTEEENKGKEERNKKKPEEGGR